MNGIYGNLTDETKPDEIKNIDRSADSCNNSVNVATDVEQFDAR